MLSALRPGSLARLRFPLAYAGQARRSGSWPRPPSSRSPAAREPGPLLPRRPGKREFLRRHAGLGDAPGEIVDADGRPRHPPRPPRVHGRPAPRARRRLDRAALRAEHGRRRNRVVVGPARAAASSSVRLRGARSTAPSRVNSVRLRYHSPARRCRGGVAGSRWRRDPGPRGARRRASPRPGRLPHGRRPRHRSRDDRLSDLAGRLALCVIEIRHQPVAHARLGDQIARMGRVGLELAAQLREVDAQIVGLGLVRGPPDLLQELALADQLALVADQDLEDVPLRRREPNGFAVGASGLLGGEVDGEVRRSRRPARPRRLSMRGAARPAAGPAARPSRTAWSRSRPRRRRGRRPCRPCPVRAESTMIGASVQPRRPSITSTPSMSGSPRSRTTTSGGSREAAVKRRAPVLGQRDLVAARPRLIAARGAGRARRRRPGPASWLGCAESAAARERSRGASSAHRPGRASATSAPSIASTNPRATDSPRPSPPSRGRRRAGTARTVRSRCSSRHARAVVDDLELGALGPGESVTSIGSSLPPWRIALSIRLTSTRSSRPRSARTGGRSSGTSTSTRPTASGSAEQGRGDHLVQATRLGLHAQRAGLQAAGVEQVADDRVEPVRGLLDRRQQLVALLGRTTRRRSGAGC